MKLRSSASSTSSAVIRTALFVATLLAAVSVPASASDRATIQIRDYEYLSDYPGDIGPPPPEAVSSKRNLGIVHVPDAAFHDGRWLRARFELSAAPTEVQSLYVSAANRGVRAFVNGVEIGSTSISDTEQFGWNYPLFFTIPVKLLNPGTNTLDLRLALTGQGWGSLRGAEIGAHSVLKPHYDAVLFWRVTGPQITTLIAILSAAIALLIWLRRRDGKAFAWFALACSMAAIRNAHFYVSADISEKAYEIWAALPLHWLTVASALFAFRLCERSYPRIEWALFGMLSFWTIALLVLDPVPQKIAVDLGYLWLFALTASLAVFTFVQWLRNWRLDRLTLFLAILISMLFGAFDFALLTSLRASEWRVYLMPYSTLFLSVVMGAVLVDEFVRARTRQEHINRELDARLAERERQLSEQHATLLRFETERATVDERQRIVRDIHDGLGSQLMSSIHLVEGGALDSRGLADVLRECVDDLRLAIDSLKPAGNDLLVVLGNFRYRMEPRLAHAGVTLDWKVAPAAKSPDLSSAQVLHVLRIVQEAVTNALKHARPSRLQICFQDDGARWTLSIVDDGTGFAPSKSHSGNGLNNMRTRSLQAGLALAVDSSSNGTSIRLGSE